MVPKAELHVHLEGTATPDLVRRIAQRNGLEVPEGVFAAPDRFAWRDFLDFLNTYNLVCSVIRTGEDYRDITYEYLAACASGRRDLRRADRLASTTRGSPASTTPSTGRASRPGSTTRAPTTASRRAS